MREVQRGRTLLETPGRGAWRGRLLTAVAALLVLFALLVPHRPQDLGAAAFLRLPLEALVYVAVVLALPSRLRRARAMLALAVGVALGAATLLKVLDMGFAEALNRRFDPSVDWRYAGSLASLVRDSFGHALGTTLLGVAVLAGVAVLLLVPLGLLRVTRVATRHRGRAVRGVAGLTLVWLVLALADVRGGSGALASRDLGPYVYGQATRIPAEIRDERRFAGALHEDPRPVPKRASLAALRGKDVLFVFVESFGRVAVEGSWFAPDVAGVLDSGTERLERAGYSSRSAFLTSPTFGGISWLAHATLQSGLWIDSQHRYDALVRSSRPTLSRDFGAAGWRTVADVPANTRDWPQGAFYGFDHVYDSRNVGYEGPRFGYPTIPDQYTLATFHRLELAGERRRPVMAEIDLISSHAPWARTPRLVDPAAVGDGSVYDGMPEQLPTPEDIWTSPTRVQAAYAVSIAYSLTAVVDFVTTYGGDDLVVVLLGDHQPATIVSGRAAGHDVPIAIVSPDPSVLDRISGWGWDEGLRPEPDAPVWRMDAFRGRFLAAYGSTGQTGSQPVNAR